MSGLNPKFKTPLYLAHVWSVGMPIQHCRRFRILSFNLFLNFYFYQKKKKKTEKEKKKRSGLSGPNIGLSFFGPLKWFKTIQKNYCQ